VPALVLVVFAAAACGGNSATGVSTSPTVDLATVARGFASLRQSTDDELTHEKQGVTADDLQHLRPVAAQASETLKNFTDTLLALPFPESMRMDARALAKATQAMSDTWREISHVDTLLTLQGLDQQLASESAEESSGLRKVEQDLGLPSSTPGT
jgi:hypothetical protein